MPLFNQVDDVLNSVINCLEHDSTIKEIISDLLSQQNELFSSTAKVNLSQIPSHDNHTKVQEYTDFAISLRESLGDEAFEAWVKTAFDLEKRESSDSHPFLRQGELSKAMFAVYANQSAKHKQDLLDLIEKNQVFKQPQEFKNFKDVILDAAIHQVREIEVIKDLYKNIVADDERLEFYHQMRYFSAALSTEVNRNRKKFRKYQTSGNVLRTIENAMLALKALAANYHDIYYRQANPLPSRADFMQSIIDAINEDIHQLTGELNPGSDDRSVMSRSEEESGSFDYHIEHHDILPEIKKVQSLIDEEMTKGHLTKVESLIPQLHLLSDLAYLIVHEAKEEDMNALIDDYNYANKDLYKDTSTSDIWKIKLAVSKTDDDQKVAAFSFLKEFFNDDQWRKVGRRHNLPEGIEQIRVLFNQKTPETDDDYIQLARGIREIASKRGRFTPLRSGKTKAIYSVIKESSRLKDIADKITSNKKFSDMINNNPKLSHNITVTHGIRSS